MEYTKNYHLPQWVETDRILMTDFNRMCVDIEEGLLGERNGVLQTGKLLLEKEYAAMDGSRELRRPGVLLNPLASAAMAESLTGAVWDGEKKVHIGRGPELGTDFLRAHCTRFSTGTTLAEYRECTASYQFVSPIDGKITGFDLLYYLFLSESYPAFADGRLTFTAYRKSGGTETKICEKAGIVLDKRGSSPVQGGIPVEVEVPLEKGVSYRLVLNLDSGGGCMSRLGFTTALEEEPDNSVFRLFQAPVTAGSHSRTVPAAGEAAHALVMLRCAQEQTGGGVAVSADGVPLAERCRETVTLPDGTAAEEVTLACGGRFNGETTLRFDLSCGETDQLRLISYAALLL